MTDYNSNREEKEVFERTDELRRNRLLARKRQRRKQMILHIVLCSAVIIILVTVTAAVLSIVSGKSVFGEKEEGFTKYIETPPAYTQQFLTVNEYSRPGTPLEEVNGIVIHYTANPGTTAQQNRSYFEGLAETKETKASSHFIIGLSGEIIMCIPLEEIAYASNERNVDTIAIECCIDNEAGKFTEKTYESLVKLTAWLVGKYDLTIDEVIRHYDVTGKNCPKYFVEHESAWDDFKIDVTKYIETYGVDKNKKKED